MCFFKPLGVALLCGVAFWSLLIIMPQLVQAIPPRPPAQLFLPNAEILAKLQPKDGYFMLPSQVRVNEKVHDLLVVMTVVLPHPVKDVEVTSMKYEVKAAKEGETVGVDIRIPAQKNLGNYRVVFALEGVYEDRRGVLDRKVLYQVVEERIQSLMTPIQFRRMITEKRKQVFQKALKEEPDKPDIRLLSDNTAKVPEEIAKMAKPFVIKQQLRVKGVGPSDDIKPYIKDNTIDNWDKRDPITVRGRLLFQDFEGTWRPLVNVSVNLYDDDTFGDEHLGTTATDWNGSWSFTVNNDDGWFQNGRDIYYKFHLGNTRWHVRDSDGDEYRWKSATHDNLSDGTVLDFGYETGSTDREAMQIFAMINRGWNHIVTAGGQDPGHVEIRFPESSTAWYSGEERVKIEAGYSDGPDVVLHEYGHALMYYAFGGERISPGGAHSFCEDEQDEGLAYSEGWATGYSLSVCPDGMFNWHEGNTESPGEWPICTLQNDAGRDIEHFCCNKNRVGENNEGRVAAAINDFRDAPNDDNRGNLDCGRDGHSDQNASNRISLATIYRDTMWGYVHNDFLEFWISLAGDLSGTTQDLAGDIMQYNWMSLPADVVCAASKIAVAERKDHQELLDGLRFFRDYALKPLYIGRHWMQIYYRHSPELGILMIKDAEARRAGMVIVEHFSRIGRSITDQKAMAKMLSSDQQFIPSQVAEAISFVMSTIEKKGSEELKQELFELSSLVSSLEGLSISEVMREADRMKAYQKDRLMGVVEPTRYAPASKKVDWELIRKNLPKKKVPREKEQ